MVFRASWIFYFWRLFEISEGDPLEKTTEPWSPRQALKLPFRRTSAKKRGTINIQRRKLETNISQ
jgi:hypothetical protein